MPKTIEEFENDLIAQAKNRNVLLKTTSERTKIIYIFVNNGYIVGRGHWHYLKKSGNYQFFREEYYENYYNGPYNNIYSDIKL